MDAVPDTAEIALHRLPPPPLCNVARNCSSGFGGVLLRDRRGVGAYEVLYASKHVTTDNAYVDADTAQVTALTSGPVAAVRVVDTQTVKKGDILVVIDPTDRRIDLEHAEAALAQTIRRVRGYAANNTALDGQITARQADLIRARAGARPCPGRVQPPATAGEKRRRIGRRADDRKDLPRCGRSRVRPGRGQCSRAHGSYQANDVLIDGMPLDQNPEVRAARANVDQARVNLERTVVRAPADGIVAERSVQVGQMVQSGTLLMTVVPVQQAYVNANFKEMQLEKVRAGQPAERGQRSLRQQRRLSRARGGLLGRHGLRDGRRSFAKRNRQLDQGGPALARPHRARSERARRQSAQGRPLDDRRHQRLPLSNRSEP